MLASMDLDLGWTAIPLAALAVYGALILLTRLNGLRSFSNMSAFDFAMTIAIGSVLATTILSPTASLTDGLLALVTLFLAQRTVAWLRRWSHLKSLLDNRPRLLVREGKVHEQNLRRCHMTRQDLHSKIREAGILRLDDVAVAVMETSGTLSVIRHRPKTRLDDTLLEGVAQ